MNTLTPLEDDSAIALEEANPDNAAIELAATYNGPCCDKCSAPMKSDGVAVCRRCGWYARLGQFVEIDHDWESYDDDAEEPAPKAAPSHAEVWLKLLPPWAWIVIATSAAVVVESIAARIVTTEHSSLRTTWSLTQLVVGFLAFMSCHIFQFLFAVADDADTGALDFIMRPFKLWIKAFKQFAGPTVGHQHGRNRSHGVRDVDRRDRRPAVRTALGLGLREAESSRISWEPSCRRCKRSKAPATTWKKRSTISQGRPAWMAKASHSTTQAAAQGGLRDHGLSGRRRWTPAIADSRRRNSRTNWCMPAR